LLSFGSMLGNHRSQWKKHDFERRRKIILQLALSPLST